MPELHELMGYPSKENQRMREEMEQSARDAKVVTIDLDPYIQHVKPDYGHGYHRNPYWHLPNDGNLGRKAAKETKFAEILAENNQVALRVTKPIDYVYHDNSFIKSFLKAGLKGVTLSEMGRKLVVSPNTRGYTVDGAVNEFIKNETKRLKRKADKEAKEAAEESDDNWIGPLHFFVPEIGTNLKLTEEWTLALFDEYRNKGLLDLLDIKSGGWQERRRSTAITIMPESTLTVDRIYIRKSVGEYSSLTFWLGKGARVSYDGNIYATKKRIRFWAKLVDVNKIKGLVSKVTVPGM